MRVETLQRYNQIAEGIRVLYANTRAGQSLGKSGNLDDDKHDLNWWRTRHKYTYNIEWSARCNAAGVGEKIGKRWQCMPGKYDPYLISNKDQIE